MRHICSNYFDFRKIKLRLESIVKADAKMMVYSKASENSYKNQSIAEWGDLESEPFGYLTPKPFSQHDRLANKKCTFSLSMCDRIFYILLKIDYIMILDHHVEPSIQGRMYCKLHDSFEHSIESCDMFHQIVQSAVDKGRLNFGEAHIDDQSILIGVHGKLFYIGYLKPIHSKMNRYTLKMVGSILQRNQLFMGTLKIFLKAYIPLMLHE